MKKIVFRFMLAWLLLAGLLDFESSSAPTTTSVTSSTTRSLSTTTKIPSITAGISHSPLTVVTSKMIHLSIALALSTHSTKSPTKSSILKSRRSSSASKTKTSKHSSTPKPSLSTTSPKKASSSTSSKSSHSRSSRRKSTTSPSMSLSSISTLGGGLSLSNPMISVTPSTVNSGPTTSSMATSPSQPISTNSPISSSSSSVQSPIANSGTTSSPSSSILSPPTQAMSSSTPTATSSAAQAAESTFPASCPGPTGTSCSACIQGYSLLTGPWETVYSGSMGFNTFDNPNCGAIYNGPQDASQGVVSFGTLESLCLSYADMEGISVMIATEYEVYDTGTNNFDGSMYMCLTTARFLLAILQWMLMRVLKIRHHIESPRYWGYSKYFRIPCSD